jgi:hypothetical protein
VQTCNKNLFIQRNRDFRIWEKKEKKKSQKANFFNFPARELVLVSKAPSWAPDFRSVLRKILTGLEHSQNPVFTQIKLGYSRNMYFVVITFSSALRDSTPEHKSLARSCWDQIWFRKKILDLGNIVKTHEVRLTKLGQPWQILDLVQQSGHYNIKGWPDHAEIGSGFKKIFGHRLLVDVRHFREIELGYSKIMSLMVKTFSLGLRDLTPEHKSSGSSCWVRICPQKNFQTSGT